MPVLEIAATTSPYARAGARLVDQGYSAVPVMPGSKVPGEFRDGDWHRMFEWQRFCDRLPTQYEIAVWNKWPDAGVCVVLDQTVKVIDIDTDDQATLDVVREILPVSPIVKRGKKGFSAFYRGAADIGPRKFKRGKQPVVEILAYGNQTVIPPTIHPETGLPYTWDGEALEAFASDQLPELTLDTAAALGDALGVLGVNPGSDRPERRERKPGGGDVWRYVNDAALADLGAWVPDLGIAGTVRCGEGYRMPAIWRGGDGLNVGVHPEGIRDFVSDESHTAVTLVEKSRGISASEALAWLQDKLGLIEAPWGGGFDIAAIRRKAEARERALPRLLPHYRR